MDKIVGKTLFKSTRYLLLFLCGVSWALYADITMRLTDINGVPLEQAGVGQPFILEVNMTNIKQSMKALTIAGLEQFQVRRTGFNMSTINGRSIVKYTYQMRIDTPGSYTIGPAVAVDKGFKFVSDRLTITVGEQRLAQEKRSKKKRGGSSALLRLSCNKEKVIVGEKLTCTLTFYSTDSVTLLTNIIEQKFSGFSQKKRQEPQKGIKKIDSVDYSYVSWQWDMYPAESGDKIIPAYGVDFEEYVQRDNFWGGLGRLLGPRAERKRIYSNGLQIKVDPLPFSDKKVSAIGSVLNVHASIKPALSKKGEGMVLTIELEGDGDIASIDVPKLNGMPDELKYYDSQQTVIEPERPGDLTKKRFEYIVQGLSCGSWEIPRQSFDYFDVKTRRYKTIETGSLLVIVTTDTATQYPSIDTDQTALADYEGQQEETRADDLHPLHLDGPWYPSSKGRALPWWLVMVLSFLPVIVWGYRGVVPRWYQYRAKKEPYVRSKKAFVIARSALKLAQNNDDSSRIHAIFVQLIADRYRWSRMYVCEAVIEQKLRSKGMDEQQIVEWKTFFAQAAAHLYGQGDDTEHEKLLTKAWCWIEQLEKVL